MILTVPDFNLEATLESGQVFGFEKIECGIYEGFILGSLVRLRQEGNRLKIDSLDVPEREVIHFFHLDFDMAPVYELLSEDPRLNAVNQRFKGLRIIRQNFWEALACFIISSNNNIKRIQKIRRNLVAEFSCPSLQFPSVDRIAGSSEEKLRVLGLGYRAPFLLNTARMIALNPELLSSMQSQSYAEAKMKLLELPGVGKKVADCVLLFGVQKYEAFPVDTWITKVVRKLYFRNRKIAEHKIQKFGQNRWKQYAGYIQQYLFHGAKSGIMNL